jgi:hypothetical protein
MKPKVIMPEPEHKTCDYPGCSSAPYLVILDLTGEAKGAVEKLCLHHHKMTSKHFSWYRESSTYGHPTN